MSYTCTTVGAPAVAVHAGRRRRVRASLPRGKSRTALRRHFRKTTGNTKMTLTRACLLTAALAAASLAQAQNTPTPSASDDTSITWKGITLYGAVDIGLQYQTHGVASSDYFPAGTEAPISKNSNGSVTPGTPSNLSQSRL